MTSIRCKNMESFRKAVLSYYPVSEASLRAFEALLRPRFIPRHTFYLLQGDIPRTIAFIKKGLFSYYYTAENGDAIIKKFFPEGYFISSTAAMLTGTASLFSIYALEDTEILEYDFPAFRQFMHSDSDMAYFQIYYLEKNWVIDKEERELSLKYKPAVEHYLEFMQHYPSLQHRLKQHEIASYLGITPTQLSRIKKELKHQHM